MLMFATFKTAWFAFCLNVPMEPPEIVTGTSGIQLPPSFVQIRLHGAELWPTKLR